MSRLIKYEADERAVANAAASLRRRRSPTATGAPTPGDAGAKAERRVSKRGVSKRAPDGEAGSTGGSSAAPPKQEVTSAVKRARPTSASARPAGRRSSKGGRGSVEAVVKVAVGTANSNSEAYDHARLVWVFAYFTDITHGGDFSDVHIGVRVIRI